MAHGMSLKDRPDAVTTRPMYNTGSFPPVTVTTILQLKQSHPFILPTPLTA